MAVRRYANNETDAAANNAATDETDAAANHAANDETDAAANNKTDAAADNAANDETDAAANNETDDNAFRRHGNGNAAVSSCRAGESGTRQARIACLASGFAAEQSGDGKGKRYGCERILQPHVSDIRFAV